MNYLMADIHGDHDSFQAMLQKIKFNIDSDYLVVIGDALDRNDKPMETLSLIRKYEATGNMLLIKGNHELFAEMYLEGRLEGSTWDYWGGTATRRQIDELTEEQQKELLSYIKNLPLYCTMDSPVYGEMILTHTGIDHNCVIMKSDGTVDVARSIEVGYERDDFHFLVGNDIHFLTKESLELLDHYIVCGHVCTFNINPDRSSKAYVSPYYMDIDCGCGHRNMGGKLCCYSVDTNEFFYL